jgi:hypothetical protein
MDSFSLESTLPHSYYNTVHGASPDKHIYNYTPLTSIFSTRVISGAKSTPDLNKLLERKQAGLICSETAVVAPLETLNTNLNYKILDDFIGRITDLTTKFLINNPLPSHLSNSLPSTPPIIIPYESKNRFRVESVDNNNSNFSNDKKSRVGFSKLIQYSINTITELPERALDDER